MIVAITGASLVIMLNANAQAFGREQIEFLKHWDRTLPNIIKPISKRPLFLLLLLLLQLSTSVSYPQSPTLKHTHAQTRNPHPHLHPPHSSYTLTTFPFPSGFTKP
jgi:hypothetical protein